MGANKSIGIACSCFVRRSETESVCLLCAEVLASSNALCLTIAEDVHLQFCVYAAKHG